MTPSARIQAAIDVVDLWRARSEGLDRVLAAWGRANRYAGSGDRRGVADLVYDTVRRLRSATWVAGSDGPPEGCSAVLGSLSLDGHDSIALASLFSGLGHAPRPLRDAELTRLGRILDAAPRPVRLDFPDWLASHLEHVPDAALAALRARAPLFLRVNTLHADPDTAIAALQVDGVIAGPGPGLPTCLRVISGGQAIARGAAYLDGLVEIQDASSQAAADYADAVPGEIVLDYCAGAGGKTLALAAAMRGTGELHVHDIAPKRLARLNARAARAGVRVTPHSPGAVGALQGRCDLVFIDAPCSGSGAWRRNPDTKWRLTSDDLSEYLRRQSSILAEATAMVRPGGRLVYATCSILRGENEDRIDGLLAGHSGYHRGRAPLVLSPGEDGDGFFACEILRATL